MHDELPRFVHKMIDGNTCIRLDVSKGPMWKVEDVIAAEPQLDEKLWGWFFNGEVFDQSELENGFVGVYEEYSLPREQHQVADTSLEDW
jgi:hypothetical protein